MRYCILGLLGLFFFCSHSTQALAQTKGEGWKLYYVDESGDRYYYDRGSVESPQKYIVILWQKITGIVNGWEEDKAKANLRLDCRRKTFEILYYTEPSDTGTNPRSAEEDRGANKQQQSLNTDSRLRALFENVCPF